MLLRSRYGPDRPWPLSQPVLPVGRAKEPGRRTTAQQLEAADSMMYLLRGVQVTGRWVGLHKPIKLKQEVTCSQQ